MMTTAIAPRSSIESRILTLQWVTLCWMLVECSVALTAAWKARSVSLLAFGSDSLVEVISAVVVLLQFTRACRVSQSRAAKICGLLLMPVLARMKRDAANQTGNKALRADAVQSATCAYLAGITLTGLLLRSAFGIHWLDPIAALAAVPILIVEAGGARKGQVCACC